MMPLEDLDERSNLHFSSHDTATAQAIGSSSTKHAPPPGLACNARAAIAHRHGGAIIRAPHLQLHLFVGGTGSVLGCVVRDIEQDLTDSFFIRLDNDFVRAILDVNLQGHADLAEALPQGGNDSINQVHESHTLAARSKATFFET